MGTKKEYKIIIEGCDPEILEDSQFGNFGNVIKKIILNEIQVLKITFGEKEYIFKLEENEK